MTTTYVPLHPLPLQFQDTVTSVNMTGGTIEFFLAGTTTPTNLFSNSAGTSIGTSITLNSGGMPESGGNVITLWRDASIALKLVLKNAAGAVISTSDDLPAPGNSVIYVGQTTAEQAAGVTPASTASLPGERARYTNLSDAVKVSASHPLWLIADETITAHITIPDGAKIYGIGGPRITNSTAGDHVFDAASKSSITIQFVKFKGADFSTTPGTAIGGYAAANTGLVTLATCTDVRIDGCEFDTFKNGVSAIECTRAKVTNNRVRHFESFGIVGSLSKYAHFDDNTITECDQTGGIVAYGIIVTGDEAGGKIQQRCTVRGNLIDGIPSWDGIMSHDCDGLDICDNDIRDVRNGIDVGHLASTNVIKNVRIANNYIKAATTDTWSTGAQHAGIAVIGYDATHRIQGATVTGNIVDGFFATGIGTAGGVPSHIVVGQCDDCTVTGNIVMNGGTLSSSAGVYLTGTLKRGSVLGNTLQGTFALGGVRCASVTADALAIGPNTCIQTTASDNAVLISGSTISQFSLDIGPTNSTAPFSQGTSTLTFSGDYLEGSITYDPASIADGDSLTSSNITVTGAAVGDLVQMSFNGDLSGVSLTGYVSATDTAVGVFQNSTGAPVDLGSATLTARVYRKH